MTHPRWQALWLPPESLSEHSFVLVHFRQHFLKAAKSRESQAEWLFESTDPGLAALPVVSKQGIGLWNGKAVYLYELAENPSHLEGRWSGLRHLMALAEVDEAMLQMLSFAAQIGTWARHHQFCGCCGAPMQALIGERAMRCVPCNTDHYPRLSPCMIALVTNGPEILLARGPHHASGVFSTLAGFVEPGETVEQCVLREVKEEVGVIVRNPQYMGSQNWPFPHALMLGFHVAYQSGDISPQPGEIEEAQWFSVFALPPLPGVHTIARYLIDSYTAQYLHQNHPIDLE